MLPSLNQLPPSSSLSLITTLQHHLQPHPPHHAHQPKLAQQVSTPAHAPHPVLSPRRLRVPDHVDVALQRPAEAQPRRRERVREPGDQHRRQRDRQVLHVVGVRALCAVENVCCARGESQPNLPICLSVRGGEARGGINTIGVLLHGLVGRVVGWVWDLGLLAAATGVEGVHDAEDEGRGGGEEDVAVVVGVS